MVLESLAIVGRMVVVGSIATVVGSIATAVDSSVFKKDPLNFIDSNYYLMHQHIYMKIDMSNWVLTPPCV